MVRGRIAQRLDRINLKWINCGAEGCTGPPWCRSWYSFECKSHLQNYISVKGTRGHRYNRYLWGPSVSDGLEGNRTTHCIFVFNIERANTEPDKCLTTAFPLTSLKWITSSLFRLMRPFFDWYLSWLWLTWIDLELCTAVAILLKHVFESHWSR